MVESTKPMPVENKEKPTKQQKKIARERWELGTPCLVFGEQWRDIVAEFIGTALFVFTSTGGVMAAATLGPPSAAFNVVVALAFGLSIATFVYATANISGGHLNPAVSLGFFCAMKMSFLKALVYILAQMWGAAFGSLLIRGALPGVVLSRFDYAVTKINVAGTLPGGEPFSQTLGQAILLEIVITFGLVFVILSTVKIPKDPKSMGANAPQAIGYAVLVGHLIGVSFTGPSMNPARTFGPALLSWYWTDHWVYWVGPMVGGGFAGILYKFVFITTKEKVRGAQLDQNQEKEDVV